MLKDKRKEKKSTENILLSYIYIAVDLIFHFTIPSKNQFN